MSMQVGPDGRIGVEVFFAANVAQHCALAGRDDNWLTSQPVAHLRERMPDELMVELSNFVHGDF